MVVNFIDGGNQSTLPTSSHRQTLSCNVVLIEISPSAGFKFIITIVIGTDWYLYIQLSYYSGYFGLSFQLQFSKGFSIV
jgi:hypothetical protein